MIIKVDRTGLVENFEFLLEDVAAHEDIQSIFILACDENNFSPPTIDPILSKAHIPIFGGVFPQIIHGKEKLSKGTIIAGFNQKIDVNIIPDLSEISMEFDDYIDGLIPDIGFTKTMLILVDGYAKKISNLIESLFNIFGLEINYIGGGAGSINPKKLEMEQTPCLFTNNGLKKDTAILALMDSHSGIGVSHGWNQKLSGPHKVTESDQNIIKSLDWKPAFKVYKHLVEKYSEKQFTEDNFFELAIAYPFGISKLDSESIVRDPFTVDENNCLYFAGEIPQESIINILTGDVDSLVKAAGKARDDCYKAFTGTKKECLLFMDCISRVLFLGDNFQKEIDAVSMDQIPVIGALTLGEIANCGQDYMELYNKTCVVGVLGV